MSLDQEISAVQVLDQKLDAQPASQQRVEQETAGRCESKAVARPRELDRASRRNHQFDLLRILFAILVLLSHAPELTDGNPSRELLFRFTRTGLTFGQVAVDGFFLLSGYLIIQSWLGDPGLVNFLRKRVLRIVPGYLVAALLSTVAVGLLAPGVAQFFIRIDGSFIKSVVLLTSPVTPPVFPGEPFPMVNGSMYTVAYEFRCYLLVAALGLCGFLRRPILCLAATILLLCALLSMAPFLHMHWHKQDLLGVPQLTIRFTASYMVGCCFYLFRDRIAFRPWFAIVATALLAGAFAFVPSAAEFALVLCGGYLMFYLGQMHLPSLSAIGRFPDISYGIYLYGWPVESLWIWFHRGSPWITFLASTVICCGLGWASWHFVERPALALKKRPTPPLLSSNVRVPTSLRHFLGSWEPR